MRPKKKKSKVAKVINTILAVILVAEAVVAAFICPGFVKLPRKHQDPEGTAMLGRSTTGREDVEIAGSILIHSYVEARLYTEKIAKYDMNNGSEEELAELFETCTDKWERCGEICEKTEELAAILEKIEAQDGYTGVYPQTDSKEVSAGLTDGLFVRANAEGTSPRYGTKEWAHQLTEDFEKYPAGKGIRGLAAQMGVDAKEAYRQFEAAQRVLRAEADTDADVYEALTQTARVVNTGCKTTVLCAAIVASGGTVTALEGAGLLASGVDLVVDFTTTGASLTLGEDSKLVACGDKALEYTGMACMVTGAATYRTANVWDKVSLIGNTVVNDLPDGKVLGGVFDVDSDGTVKMCGWAINGDSAKKNEKTLEDAGMSSADAKLIGEAAAAPKGSTAQDVIRNVPLEEVLAKKIDDLIDKNRDPHSEEEENTFLEEAREELNEAEQSGTLINVLTIPDDKIIEHDVTEAQIDGAWEMDVCYQNANSAFAEDISKFLKKLFENVDEVEIGDAKTVRFTWRYYVNVHQVSGKQFRVELFHREDEAEEAYWGFYEGKFKDGTLKVKLVDNRSVTDQGESIGVGLPEELELEFMRMGDGYYVYGSSDMDSYVLSADISCSGVMVDPDSYFEIGGE